MVRRTGMRHAGAVLHVTQRGHSRLRVFAGPADYLFYLECVAQAAPTTRVSIHAYALMPNHVHLLLTSACDDSVPRLMQAIGRRYVRYFNAREGRSGSLWEGRYRSALIGTDEYLLACMRYIELNPVRAGLTHRPDDHAWSSYRANALGAENALVRAHPTYEALGTTATSRREAYRALFGETVSEATLQAIRPAPRCSEQLFRTTGVSV